MRLTSYFLAIIFTLGLGSISGDAQAKPKEHCKARASAINFGDVAIRDGVSNRTSTNIEIECRRIETPTLGVCIHLGSGHGNERGGGTRYLKRNASNRITYVIRDGGHGGGYPLWENGIFKRLPVYNGKVDASITAYAEILATAGAHRTGTYKAPYPTGHSYVDIGVESCGMPTDSTAKISGLSASAHLTSSCEVDGASLGFGRVPGTINDPIDASTDIVVRCTHDTPFNVRLGPGTSPGVSNPEFRAMSNGSNLLRYGLYMDHSRTQPWGDEAFNSFQAVGAGSSQRLEVHGRIHSGQEAISGTYRDSVLITVEY
ncbi:spore coat U domain-containing protein [Sulfitobacter sp. R18_1]|uniref:Csu type fimbrial protein n=1 Tax=Sulfitobacter sp. R18_1 TaxID=2821104 RepID=UPI001ADB684B|nr:spore coat U domain-containing protein [Sulfitobacter sp. R18_1]MBO9428694.1 spore coat protein U domain-containing protein [Sulfitobacter sp. R18_1]